MDREIIIDTERWEWITGYEGRYKVSDRGAVSSYLNGGGIRKLCRLPRRILRHGADGGGYRQVRLTTNDKTKDFKVHRLVLEAFIGPCSKGKECAHLDGTRTNNRVDNLRWVTRTENQSHRVLHGTSNRGERSGRAKLTEKKVHDIRKRLANGETKRSISSKYGVTTTTINQISTGKIWGHLKSV